MADDAGPARLRRGHVRGIVPALLGPGDVVAAARLVPGPVRRRPPGRAPRARRPRLGPAAGTGASSHAVGDGRAGHHHGGARPHGHRADLDHHRADAGRARVIGYRMVRAAARSSTCCAGRAGRRRPAPLAAATRRASPSPPSSAHAGAGGHAGRVRPAPASPSPTSAAAAGRVPGHVDAAGGGRAASWRRRAASCTRTTSGIDKVAHEYGLRRPLRRRAARRRPARRPTSSTRCRPARRCWSRPTTARSTSATA